MDSEPFLASVHILHGKTPLLSWYVVPVEKTTFASLVEMICGASELTENIPASFKRTLTRKDFQGTHIFLSMSSSTSREDAGRSEVSCALDVKSSCLVFGRFISIELLRVENVPNPKVVGPDAFSRMMSASKSLATQLKFPELRGSEQLRASGQYRGDWRIFNDVVSFLKDKNLGFTNGCESTSRKAFVGVLADALFELLPPSRQDRLAMRGIHLPPVFDVFPRKERQLRYNDPEEHRHGKLPPLQRSQ